MTNATYPHILLGVITPVVTLYVVSEFLDGRECEVTLATPISVNPPFSVSKTTTVDPSQFWSTALAFCPIT